MKKELEDLQLRIESLEEMIEENEDEDLKEDPKFMATHKFVINKIEELSDRPGPDFDKASMQELDAWEDCKTKLKQLKKQTEAVEEAAGFVSDEDMNEMMFPNDDENEEEL
jgi:hypothetical protein